MRIYVTVEGLDQLQARLTEMVQRGKSLRVPMGKAGEIMLHSTMENFEAEGRPRWTPRSRLTQMIMDYGKMEEATTTKRYQRAKKWTTKAGILRKVVEASRGHKILQVSGDLKKAISLDVRDTEVSVGAPDSIKYARIHQLGGEIRPKNKKALYIPIKAGRFLLLKKVTIPARPYLLLQPDEKQRIIRVFDDWLAGEK